MTGVFRRAIRLSAVADWAEAEMEDDFHHFAVAIRHDRARVTEVSGRAVRYPWSRCPMAVEALAGLTGLAVGAHPTAIYRHTDPLAQCTHMLEIAGLAVAQASRGPGRRRYDAAVTEPVDGRIEADLLCDGKSVMRWVLQDGIIASPVGYRGRRPADFRSAVLRDLPPEEAETLLILRRAVALGSARGLDVDRFANAAEMNRGAACFVFRSGVAEHAARRYGSVRDFTAGDGPLGAPSRTPSP